VTSSRRGLRARTASALVVVGVVLALAGAVLGWFADDVFDRDRFVRHAVASLDSEAVQGVVGARITDRIVSVQPDLVVVRPLIDRLAVDVVGTAAFRTVLARAVGVAHDELFSPAGADVLVDLRGIGAMVARAAESSGVELSPRVGELGAVVARYETARAETRLIRFAERIRSLSLLLPVAGLGLIGAGVLLTPDRRRTLLWAASTLGTTALVALVLLAATRNRLIAVPADPTTAAAASAVLDEFLAGLRRTLTLGLAVAVITLIAVAPPRSAELVRRWASQGRGWVVTGPSTAPGRLARAGAFTALGAVLLLWPGTVVTLAASAAGLALLVLALDQVLGRGGSDDPIRPDRPGWRPGSVGLVRGLGVGALLVAVLATFVIDRAVASPPEALAECNGHRSLCDRRFDEVVLLATHNANATVADGFFAPYQELSVLGQLEAGARALLLDVWPGTPSTRVEGLVLTDRRAALSGAALRALFGETGASQVASAIEESGATTPGGGRTPGLYLCHAACELGARPLQDTLDDIDRFVRARPGEVVVLFIEDHVPGADLAAAIGASGLAERLYEHRPGDRWPTLGEMVLTDRRVVVLVEDDGGEPGWFHAGFDLVMDTPYRFTTLDSLDGPDACDPNRGPADARLFLVNHWVQPDGPVRPSVAARANEPDRIIERVERCEAQRGRRPTMVAVDFLGRGDALAAVDALNGVGERSP
jgi:hypothetical protein